MKNKNTFNITILNTNIWMLFLVLLILKVTEIVDWSWFIIFIPLYPLLFVLAMFIVAGMLYVLSTIIETIYIKIKK